MQEKIIGGEFRIDVDALKGEIKHDISPNYSIGRTCLYAVLDTLKSSVWGGVLLPDYICSSVAEVPLRIGLPIEHYHITASLLPDIDELKEKIKRSDKYLAVVLISYFGIVDLDDVIKSIRYEYPEIKIIIDDVQDFYGFGHHVDYDYCFTSYRKWFAVPDGSDVLQKDGILDLKRFDGHSKYALYKVAGNLLKNHVEMVGDSISLELIDKGEDEMDKEYRYACSELGIKLFQRIDTEAVAEKRRNNAKILHDGLNRLDIRHYYNPKKVPLFVPILIHNRDRIRKKLFEENIFVPVHWPVIDIKLQGNNELYKTELSLICDQRYDEEDMERMLSEIKNAM